MSSNNGHVIDAVNTLPDVLSDSETCIAIDQLRHVIQMLDQSDISDLEVRLAEANARLVLRKTKSSQEEIAEQVQTLSPLSEDETPSQATTLHVIRSPFVGIFHCWSKSKEPLQLAIKDSIKEGQHIGVIQSLDIPNEVEATCAGRIVEILVEDGQPVEFGQPLFSVDTQ